MDKKPTDNKTDKKQENLENLKFKINEFGQIESNIPTEKLNEFLDENLEDLKLKNRKEESTDQDS